jgi:hypothetical protein
MQTKECYSNGFSIYKGIIKIDHYKRELNHVGSEKNEICEQTVDP